MESKSELLKRAMEAEHLASIVSYAPDKARLRELAAELRERAEQADDPAGRRSLAWIGWAGRP